MIGEAAAEDQDKKDQGRKEAGTPTEGAGSAPLMNVASGTMRLREHVVAKIAGMAAREVAGVHSMGKGGFLENLVRREDVRRGVKVKVGEKEAAFDLWLRVEYGCHIPTVADLVRERITERVFTMTGLLTKEINIEVMDVVFPEQKPESRVE